MNLPVFFTIKPNIMGGRFFFYFGPWDRMEALRNWYCAHGLDDPHNRIRDWQMNGRPDHNDFEGMVFDPDPGCPLLILKGIPHTPAEIANLVHEVHHMVQRWTFSLGIYTSRDSEEIFAYTEGKLVEMVLDYLWHGTVAQGMEFSDDPLGAP